MIEFRKILETQLLISTKIHAIKCEKDDIKVELAVCEDCTPTVTFQRVFVNKVREHNRKWADYFNNLWRKRFEVPIKQYLSILLKYMPNS